jgi:hypothetical protein
MRAVEVVFVQPRIHNLREFHHIHWLVMIALTLPLERTNESLNKRLSLEGLRSGPVSGDMLLKEKRPGVLYVVSYMAMLSLSLTTVRTQYLEDTRGKGNG